MRATCWLLVLIGCAKPQAQQQPPTQAQTADATAPLDAVPIDAAVPVDALLPVHKRVVDEAEGYGACKLDEDCVLTSWQGGCCTSSCSSYAISAVELARREKQESCPKVRTRPCPPPAACAPPTHMAFEASCKAGTCFARRHVLPPPPRDPGI